MPKSRSPSDVEREYGWRNRVFSWGAIAIWICMVLQINLSLSGRDPVFLGIVSWLVMCLLGLTLWKICFPLSKWNRRSPKE